MTLTNPVSAGDTATAVQYNNLRLDTLSLPIDLSAAGVTAGGTGGSSTQYFSHVAIATSGTSGQNQFIWGPTAVATLPEPWGEADADWTFFTAIKLSATTNQDVLWGIYTDDAAGVPPAAATAVNPAACFVVNDGTLFAMTGSGAANENTDISSGITLTNYNTYRIVYDQSTPDWKFYINDSLKATHTTGIASTDNDLALYFSIETQENAAKTLSVARSTYMTTANIY